MSVLPNPVGEKSIDAKPQQTEGFRLIFYFSLFVLAFPLKICIYLRIFTKRILQGWAGGSRSLRSYQAVVQRSCSLWMQSWHQSILRRSDDSLRASSLLTAFQALSLYSSPAQTPHAVLRAYGRLYNYIARFLSCKICRDSRPASRQPVSGYSLRFVGRGCVRRPVNRDQR